MMNRAVDERIIDPLSRVSPTSAAELMSNYRERNNRARAAVANHQAKWSAVDMSRALERYKADLALLHAEQKVYRSWLSDQLVPQARALLPVTGSSRRSF
jgi:hypothetical protein